MTEQISDKEALKKDLNELIESLTELSDSQKHCLRSRWLDQVLWLESAAKRNRLAYASLRLTAIIGGIIVPALVSAEVQNWIPVSLSLVVAISAATEEFFHCGERWRHYRRTAELLKSEGWQFFQKSGRYQDKTHDQSYTQFAAQVEQLSQSEVETYIQLVQEKQEKQPRDTTSADTK